MADKTPHSRKALPTANYGSAVARAVAWLGDRYLLAKPINGAKVVDLTVDIAESAARLRASLRPRTPLV
jgi:hypothetical protein